MQSIEQHAKNFIEAARQLLETSGAFTLKHDMFDDEFRMQLSEENFDKLTEGVDFEVIQRGHNKYPLQKQVIIGGAIFFCLSKGAKP